MKKLNKQQGLSLFYIALGIWVAYVTSDIRALFQVASEDVGPKMFPYCCAAGLILCGIGHPYDQFMEIGGGHGAETAYNTKTVHQSCSPLLLK